MPDLHGHPISFCIVYSFIYSTCSISAKATKLLCLGVEKGRVVVVVERRGGAECGDAGVGMEWQVWYGGLHSER